MKHVKVAACHTYGTVKAGDCAGLMNRWCKSIMNENWFKVVNNVY